MRYRAKEAEKRSLKNARRPKACKLATHHKLRYLVATKLSQQWSPEQICGDLKRRYKGQASMTISHETIYRTLYVQTRGALKKELASHLRTHRGLRRARSQKKGTKTTGAIQNEISIRDRPKGIEKRTSPGHWEGDLISGSGNTHIATLVERKSRFVILIKVKSKDAETVHRALAKRIKRLPNELRRSLTWDRGAELAKHRELCLDADIKIYFCDPQSPWQRGTNENTNGLLRQYFPKKTNLSVHSQVHLSRIAKRLNQRPRKTLDFQTPAEVLNQALR